MAATTPRSTSSPASVTARQRSPTTACSRGTLSTSPARPSGCSPAKTSRHRCSTPADCGRDLPRAVHRPARLVHPVAAEPCGADFRPLFSGWRAGPSNDVSPTRNAWCTHVRQAKPGKGGSKEAETDESDPVRGRQLPSSGQGRAPAGTECCVRPGDGNAKRTQGAHGPCGKPRKAFC